MDRLDSRAPLWAHLPIAVPAPSRPFKYTRLSSCTAQTQYAARGSAFSLRHCLQVTFLLWNAKTFPTTLTKWRKGTRTSPVAATVGFELTAMCT